tara:strand:+ start:188 stop:1252 length:1065 start_codon:yes stop_codon:yes gene_type:complete
MAKKAFFKDRTIKQVKSLNLSKASTPRNLVRKINDLDPKEDALEIRTHIIPGKFYKNTKTGAEASRKCLKHGDLIALSQPQSQAEAYSSPEIPLAIRAKDFSQLESIREEDINYIGYSFRPVQGRDRTKRVVPFVWIPEGIKLFGYAENLTKKGIEIVNSYSDAERVRKEGANVVVTVPSRTKGKQRYEFRLINVPMIRGNENLASVLGLKPAILQDELGEPKKGRPTHDTFNIRYTWASGREGSEVMTFYPQDIAAYIGIIKDESKKHNLTPLEINPFALASNHQAEFYTKLNNNVLIFDPTLTSKDKLRKPHLAEKCILLARAIGKFGHDEFSYWDPGRDGKLKDYDWKSQD